MALRVPRANSARCVEIAIGLIALSVVLQWLAALVWAQPARTKLVLEFLYAGRGAVLQALHVMAFALLTVGVLQTKSSVAICAGWTAAACLIETVQHPALVSPLLQWAQTVALPQSLLDATIGLLANARFAWSEIVASIVGGAAALEVVRREVMR